MILDYNPTTACFILKVLRSEGVDIQDLMKQQGLDLSLPLSTSGEAVLFTKDPYCAATYAKVCTPRARGQLHGILQEIEASWAPSSQAHIACPADRELWGFQKADIEYALRRTNTLVGDQPGLGKTPIAICYANEIRAKRVLVICPASIRLQWAQRIREWTTMPWPYHVHVIINGKRGVNPDAAWTICSYELASSEAIGFALSQLSFDCLLLDEAHYLKTPDSKRTHSIFGGGTKRNFPPLVERCNSTMALTGTPLLNRPKEAYTLSRALCWDAIDWRSEDSFEDRYNPSQKTQTQAANGKTTFYIDERSGRHGELQNRLRSHFMVRHLKREVMTQLKLPVYDLIQLDASGPAVKQALAAESLLDIDPDNLTGGDAVVMGQIATVRKEMGIAMAPLVADHIEMLLYGGEEKLVIFAWHIEVLNILQERLSRYGLVRIDGRTSSVQKTARVKSFVERSNVQIALGNMLSMGVGTDGLQLVSSHALIAEPDWTPGNNIQAFDRLDRGGQIRQVQGDIFVVPGSFAERVLASALRKNRVIHQALDWRL